MLKAIPLSFTKFGNQVNKPLIICHGLFGSKQNWKSLAKTINEQTQAPVYTVVSGPFFNKRVDTICNHDY